MGVSRSCLPTALTLIMCAPGVKHRGLYAIIHCCNKGPTQEASIIVSIIIYLFYAYRSKENVVLS